MASELVGSNVTIAQLKPPGTSFVENEGLLCQKDKVASLAASGHNDEAFTSYEAMVPLTDILEPMIRPVPGSVIKAEEVGQQQTE